jgi:hypothetical protein
VLRLAQLTRAADLSFSSDFTSEPLTLDDSDAFSFPLFHASRHLFAVTITTTTTINCGYIILESRSAPGHTPYPLILLHYHRTRLSLLRLYNLPNSSLILSEWVSLPRWVSPFSFSSSPAIRFASPYTAHLVNLASHLACDVLALDSTRFFPNLSLTGNLPSPPSPTPTSTSCGRYIRLLQKPTDSARQQSLCERERRVRRSSSPSNSRPTSTGVRTASSRDAPAGRVSVGYSRSWRLRPAPTRTIRAASTRAVWTASRTRWSSSGSIRTASPAAVRPTSAAVRTASTTRTVRPASAPAGTVRTASRWDGGSKDDLDLVADLCAGCESVWVFLFLFLVFCCDERGKRWSSKDIGKLIGVYSACAIFDSSSSPHSTLLHLLHSLVASLLTATPRSLLPPSRTGPNLQPDRPIRRPRQDLPTMAHPQRARCGPGQDRPFRRRALVR